MELCNLGALISIALSAITLLLVGLPLQNPISIALMSFVLVISAVILEVNKLRPRLLFMPLWLIGYIPLAYGLWFIHWGALFTLLPLWFISKSLLNSAEKHKIESSISVTHKYTDVDGDTLRDEIHENLERREESLERAKDLYHS